MAVDAVSNRILEIRAMMPSAGTAQESADFQTLYNTSRTANAANAAGVQPVHYGLTVTGVSSGQDHPAARVTFTGAPSAELYAQAAPYMDIINEASRTFDVPANIIMAIIKCESD